MRGSIQEQFNAISEKYDSQRKKLIPCFDDFYSAAVSFCKTGKNSPDILDIGAGTGLFSSFLFEKYPDARFTLIDISEKMLLTARERFKGLEQFQFIDGDFTDYRFTQKYDIVISALAIHHLTDSQKKKLYKRIYKILRPGGVFVNAEQALGNTPAIESVFREEWFKRIDAGALSREEIEGAHARMKFDKMASMEKQLKWLRKSGFKDVDCVYRYYNFTVLFAGK